MNCTFVRKAIFFSVFFPQFILAQTPFWEQTYGPGGGEINAIRMTQGGVLFAGTNGGGMYRSFDNGQSWRHVGLSYDQVYALASKGEYIYAGTFDNSVNRMRVTEDRWTKCDSGLADGGVVSLGVNTNGDIFVVISYSAQGGIFRSTNNGQTWNRSYTDPFRRTMYGFAFSSVGHIFAGVTHSGMIKSSDNGNTWSSVSDVSDRATFYSFAVEKNGGMYALGKDTAGGQYHPLLYRSTDDGRTWTQLHSLPQRDYYGMVVSQVGSIFLSNYGGLTRSTDYGATWSNIQNGLPYFINFRGVEANGSDIFAGTYGNGLYRSTNGGLNWSHGSYGLNQTSVSSIYEFGNGDLLAGTAGFLGAVYHSTNDGESWTQIGVRTSRVLSVCATSGGFIFAGTERDGVFYTNNLGATWGFTGLGGQSVQSLYTNSGGHILAGTFSGRVYRSTTNGTGWVEMNYPTQNGAVCQIVRSANGFLFGATARGVVRSTDEGTNWVNTGLSTSFVFGIAAAPNGDVIAGTDGSVYVSKDGGTTWKIVDSSLAGVIINSVAASNSGRLFAAVGTNWEGVYSYVGDSTGWTLTNSGLTNTNVGLLRVTQSGHLLAGTGGGIFRSFETVTAVQPTYGDFPEQFWLWQNYPNPFNPQTTIELDLPQRIQVKLIVYDILGREVKKLIEETRDSGKHSLSFDASQLSSGVYFYRLIAGEYIQTRKMVVQK